MGDEGESRIGLVIANRAAEAVEGVAKVAEGVASGSIGPQHLSQHLAGVRPVRFHGQIGQQCAHLDRLEPRNRLVVQDHLEGAQEV